MAGAIDATLRKFHASLNVSELDRSIAFYRVLLGVEPAKVRSDYAKFELAEPPLVLSLIPGRPGPGGHLNHAGLRVRNAEELVEIQRRLEAAGMPTQREEGVECCYARQTKFWITDPDGRCGKSTSFTRTSPSTARPRRLASSEVQVQAAAAPRRPEPGNITFASRCRRAFRTTTTRCTRCASKGRSTRDRDAANRAGLFAESLRALRPGAPIYIHGLAGDRREPIGSSHCRVRQPRSSTCPAASSVVDELARAGFADIQIEKLSQTAYFVVDGVPMREMRVVARKPGYRPKVAAHQRRVSRADGARRRRLRQRVSSRRADAAERSRLAGALEERGEQRVPVPEAGGIEVGRAAAGIGPRRRRRALRSAAGSVRLQPCQVRSRGVGSAGDSHAEFSRGRFRGAAVAG